MIALKDAEISNSFRQEESHELLYLNPTVTESEDSDILNENVNSDGVYIGDEDLATDGEQRYETEGEETS